MRERRTFFCSNNLSFDFGVREPRPRTVAVGEKQVQVARGELEWTYKVHNGFISLHYSLSPDWPKKIVICQHCGELARVILDDIEVEKFSCDKPMILLLHQAMRVVGVIIAFTYSVLVVVSDGWLLIELHRLVLSVNLYLLLLGIVVHELY